MVLPIMKTIARNSLHLKLKIIISNINLEIEDKNPIKKKKRKRKKGKKNKNYQDFGVLVEFRDIDYIPNLKLNGQENVIRGREPYYNKNQY